MFLRTILFSSATHESIWTTSEKRATSIGGNYTELAGCRFKLERFNAFVTYQSTSENQTRLYVVGFEPRVTFENGCRVIASGQHAEDVFDGEPSPADDRLAAEDLRVNGDAFQ